MTRKQPHNTHPQKLRRCHRMNFLLNEEEMKLFNRFVAKYRIKNQSRFMRECIMRAIFKQLNEDHPTLF